MSSDEVELGPASPQTSTDDRQILCLSGGGYRGLYTALLLEALEEKAKRPLVEVFDVVAGTSIGGLLAAGLALGVPAKKIRRAVETHGPSIFDRRIRWGQLRLPISNPLRMVYRARYSQDPLREAIGEMLGTQAHQRFSEVSTPLVISAVEASSGTPRLLRSAGLAGSNASNLSLRDGLLATSAAPTYFPPHRVEGRVFVDGGLVANAPDLAAVTETIRHLACRLRDVRVLSIGTASAPREERLTAKAPGLVEWLVRHRLVQLTLSAQEQLAVDHSSVLLESRYLRLDHVPSQTDRESLGLDKATHASTDALRRAAEATVGTFSGSNHGAIGRFLSHRSRPRNRPVG